MRELFGWGGLCITNDQNWAQTGLLEKQKIILNLLG